MAIFAIARRVSAAPEWSLAVPVSAVADAFVRERDRWNLWLAPFFAIGIAIYFGLPSEPPLLGAALVLLALLSLGLLVRSFALAVLVTIAGITAAGFLAAKLRTEAMRAPVLVTPLAAAVVTGRLEIVEPHADGGQRLTIKVRAIEGLAAAATPARVRVRVRKTAPVARTAASKGTSEISAVTSVRALAPGDAVRLTARLSPPPPPIRPGGYDFARAAYFQGIGAVGFARKPPERVDVEGSTGWLERQAAAIQRLRREIGRRIEAALPGDAGIMANALMTGERGGISREINDLYRDAGIFHILSISGLHMAIMGGSVFFALRSGLAMVPAIALRHPIKKWAAAVAAAATLGFLLISGGAHPAVRSFIMIVIMFLAILLDRPAIALRNVSIAALVILCVMPESLFNAGFQMSFAAVVGLIAAYETYQARQQVRRRQGITPAGRAGRTGWLAAVLVFAAGTIATTVVAGLATAPIGAYHFHAGQLYSVLTNMLAIPVANFIVMPAALAAFIVMPFGLEAWPLQVMGWGIDAMTWSARCVAGLAGAVVAIPSFPDAGLQTMVAGGLWLAIWRRRWRLLGVPVLIAGLGIAALGDRPAALVGRGGQVVAIRGADGRLAAIKARSADFEMGRWLEADGDSRKPVQAWAESGNRGPFRCDLDGCLADIGRYRVAMPRSPAALVDDCRRANVLIMTFPKPPGCVTDAQVFDYPALRESGALAIYLERDGGLRIESVEAVRGVRPWTEAARREAIEAQWRQRRANAQARREGTATAAPGGDEQADAGPVRGAKETADKASRPRSTTPQPSPRAESRPELEDGHPLYWFQ